MTKFKRLLWIPLVGLGLFALWRATGFTDYLRLPRLLGLIRELGYDNPWAPVIVSFAIGIGSLLMIPINLLLLAVATAFPGWKGFFCGLAGSVLAAWFGASVGRFVGAGRAQRRLSGTFEILSEELRENGVSAVITLCWVPVAPSVVNNIVAGICRLPYWKLTIGTIIGFLPGLIVLTLLGRNMRKFMTDPSSGAALVGLGLIGLIVLGTIVGRRTRDRLKKRKAQRRKATTENALLARRA